VVVSEKTEWKGNPDGRRLAGVSSFGFGGTNAHVILEETPEPLLNASVAKRPFQIFTLCAKNENALQQYADRYEDFLNANVDVRLEDLCYSANAGRASFSSRLAIVTSSTEDLISKLKEYSAGNESADIITGAARLNHKPKIAFLFPGQGAQYIGMGKELYDTHPLFRKIINQCDEILRSYLEKSLLEVLFYEKDEKLNPINETTYTQPALFAVEYALGKLWMSWGVDPDVMMGHSAGEYVAACLAGVFSLEDGLKLTAERGRLMQTMTSDGEMYTVFENETEVKKALNGFEDYVSVASINSPVKTVISGNKDSLSKILPYFDSKQIEYKKINVSIASHSPLMVPMINEFRKVCSTVKYSNAKIPIVSNITAEIVTDKISNPEYWCEHIMSTVRFSASIKECLKSGVDVFIDLGSMPTSIGMAQETIQNPDIKWIASIKKNFTVWETMLQGLGTLYVNGFEPDWESFDKDFSHKKTGLPTYPFQRQRYWIEDLKQKSVHTHISFKKKSGSALLGRKLSLADSKEIIFNNYLSSDNPAFIREHGIYGKPVFPTTAYIELAMEAGKEILGTKELMIEDLLLHKAFLFEEDALYNVQIILKETEGRTYSFEIYSCKVAGDNNGISESEWTKNVSGKIFRSKNPEISKDGQSKVTSEQMTEIEPDDFYERTFNDGIEYSGSFRIISELSVNGNSAFAHIKTSAETEEQFKDYIFHPVLLDACLHTAFAPILEQMNPELIYLPIGIGSVSIYDKVESEVRCVLEYDSIDDSKSILNANLKVYSADENLIAVVRDIQMKKVTKKDFIESTQNYLNDWLYEVKWKNASLESLTSETFTFPATDGIKNYIDASLPGYIDEDHLALYRKALDRVELLCSEYIIKAFEELGYRFEVNSGFRTDELIKKLNVVNQHHKLFGRLLEILAEESYLEKADGGWKILKTPKPDSIKARLEKLKIQGIDAGAEMSLLVKCGSVLSEILSGKTDPLQLLFPDGDFKSLTDLYEKSPSFRTMNNILKDAVSTTLENIPEGRKVRILEVGAGTGATTSYVLKHLTNKNVEYMFTDVSQLFLTRAKEKFSEYSNIEYKLFDLEKDPAGQNFDESSFDIIIASNVIHATKDLKQSLNNLKRLLKNNGRLIFTEATQRQKWVDLVFGLTEGWWRFEDTGLRKDYALLDETGWIGLLNESGFNEAEVISVADKKRGSLTSQSVIIADMSIAGGTQYMIVAEENEFSKLLKSEIESKGNTCELITPGRFYSDGFQKKNGSVLPEGIILFLDSKETDSADNSEKDIEDKDLEKLTGQACENVIKLIQNISKSGFTKIPKLAIITKNAQPVIDSDRISGLAFSTVSGLGKVISIEYPELNCKRIDIDSLDAANARNILKELDSTFNEGEIAYRNGDRFVSRLERSATAAAKDIRIDPDGTYLITGGTKGLGLLFAKYLADKGAQHLVLLSRSNPDGENEKTIDEMKASGVDVKIVSADVTLKKELEKTITDISAAGHLLKGIIHSAGLLDDGVIANQNREKFDRVLAPKIMGSWYLSELTKDLELDFFIMFSSIASVLGSAGQSNHSAANSFLDSFAHYRRSRGLPAMTINWGVWTDIGSAANIGADKQEKIAGLKVIAPELGIRLFDKIFSKDYVRVGAFNVDWKRFEEKNYSKQMSEFVSVLLNDEKKDNDGIKEKKTGTKKINIIDEIRNAPAEDHNRLLTTYFQKLISGILGLKDTDLDAETPLNAIGLDSLMAIELKNKVNMELGVDLNLVRYMEDTNIIKLAKELEEHLTKKLNDGAMNNGWDKNLQHEVSEEDSARELLDNLENMSEEEIERLLNENS
jgi:malonyl CoA-acyl carrier protein transacylase